MDDSRPLHGATAAPLHRDAAAALAFDAAVAPGGYRWWYLDALSDDRQYGLTIIAFIGSVFSPYYARARRRQPPADAVDHCAFNVALYATSGAANAPRRWSMTERGRAAVVRSARRLAIGPSSLSADPAGLTLRLDETTCPWPSRLRGTVRLGPAAFASTLHRLDAHGRHRWQPLAPQAPVEVDFVQPVLRWRGHGYFDTNDGDEPLEDAFDGWHWSRTVGADNTAGTVVHYDVAPRDGRRHELSLHYATDGSCQRLEPGIVQPLAPTGWRLARLVRSEAGDAQSAPRLLRTLEDTPFYSRSLIAVRAQGRPCLAMHESLSLARFRVPWVRCLLPFRMPRRAHGPPPRTE
jgi:carotenoid 1,2-hydratase